MSVLPPSDSVLDPRTERILQERGIDAFLQQGAGSSTSQPQPARPPLELDAGIWSHLLSNRMSELPGDIECVRRQTFVPRPNPDETCRPSGSRPRDPDDQDDPEAQRETKRTCIPDLNKIPEDEDEGGAGGSNQGHNGQQVDWSYFPGWPGPEIIDSPFRGIDTRDTSSLWDISGGAWLGIPAPRSRKEDLSLVGLIISCYLAFTAGSRHDELKR
jgi:hypothetical protein